MRILKEVLALLSVPLILFVIYLTLIFFWKLLGLPSDDQMLVVVKDYFLKYGLWIVFISALIEGFLLLGQYFPGGFVIFLGVISRGRMRSKSSKLFQSYRWLFSSPTLSII